MNEVSLGYVMIWVAMGFLLATLYIWIRDGKIFWADALGTWILSFPLGVVLGCLVFSLSGKTVVWSLSQ